MVLSDYFDMSNQKSQMILLNGRIVDARFLEQLPATVKIVLCENDNFVLFNKQLTKLKPHE